MKKVLISLAILSFLAPTAVLAVDREESAESASLLTPAATTTPAERSPLVEAIHQARLDGNESLVRALEAQIPKSKNLGGDAAGGDFQLRHNATFWGEGDPAKPEAALKVFGADIDVRSGAYAGEEVYQTMASDSEGNIFVAWEDDFFGANHYIQIFKSADGGATWVAYGYIGNGTTHLSQPSIAVGEGTDSLLLISYVVDNGTDIPHVEVGTSPLTSYSLTTHSLPFYTHWDGYSKPVIWTDSFDFDFNWYAYLTAEGAYDSASDDINVAFWRSTDFGATWGTDHQVLWGNTNANQWIDPDGSYGTTANNVYVACYNGTDDTIYTMISEDFGATFGAQIAVATVSPEPAHAVDPDIEAATSGNNVMLVCTKGSATSDDIGQIYSTDSGATYGTFWSLDGYLTDTDEFAADLTANEGGGSWHLAYSANDWYVRYKSRPQDLSAFWPSAETIVNDSDWASSINTKKGITSVWGKDYPVVGWSDYEFATGYETLVDFVRVVFSDGFESGNTSQWTTTVP